MLLLWLSSVSVSAASPDDYANAVHRALTLVQFAERGDSPSLQQAIQVLETAPGPAQPEVLSDLRGSPPRLRDADQRLSALYAALQANVDTPDPQQAQQQLHDVLSMPRYAGLGSGPSLLDRALSAILRGIATVLNWLGLRNAHLHIPVWVWLALAGAVILFVILWPARAGLTLGGRSARYAAPPAAASPSVNFFSEADRLAGAGDYVGAIRALAGGVSVRLSGERVWDQSPYTVRELFSRSENPEALRPLLRTFEDASYGHRALDAAAYARAAEAAAPFRPKAA